MNRTTWLILKLVLLTLANMAAPVCVIAAFVLFVRCGNCFAPAFPAFVAFLLFLWQPWLLILCIGGFFLFDLYPVTLPVGAFLSAVLTHCIYDFLHDRAKLDWLLRHPREKLMKWAGVSLLFAVFVSLIGYWLNPPQDYEDDYSLHLNAPRMRRISQNA